MAGWRTFQKSVFGVSGSRFPDNHRLSQKTLLCWVVNERTNQDGRIYEVCGILEIFCLFCKSCRTSWRLHYALLKQLDLCIWIFAFTFLLFRALTIRRPNVIEKEVRQKYTPWLVLGSKRSADLVL